MELFSLFDFIFPLGDPVLAQMYGFNKVDTWILWVIAAAVYVVVCAFKGVGLYAMAKKRGNSALLCLLGFVPFASTYLMGELAGGLRLGKAKIEVEVGEVSGSLRKGYSKIKHFGLFVMIAELILCIGYAVQDIPQSVIFMNPDLYEVRPVASGNLTYLAVFFAESVPAWLVTTMNFFSIFCTIFYFIWLVLFIFLCMSFFRTYAPASYIWMVVLCAIIPVLTGFLIFAFRNRDPIDYDKYMQERMERIRRAQQAQYGPYGGNPYGNPYGQNPYGQNPYGQNPYGQNPYGTPYGQNGYGGQGAPKEPDDPFGEYSSSPSRNDNGGGDGGTQGGDPFGEYSGGNSGENRNS